MKIVKEAVYIHLFHGRKDPKEEMKDWGEDGPVIGPFALVHVTYMDDWKLTMYGTCEEYVLGSCGDLLFYDGMYYGDAALITGDALESNPKLDIVEFYQYKAMVPVKKKLNPPSKFCILELHTETGEGSRYRLERQRGCQ